MSVLASVCVCAISILMTACAPKNGKEAIPVARLYVHETTLFTGEETRVSLFYTHPSPALPAIAWEADGGSIVPTRVANEIVFRAPRLSGRVTIKARASLDDKVFEAEAFIRVRTPDPRFDYLYDSTPGSVRSSAFGDRFLFADASPLYVSPQEPSAIDPILLKFRTRAGFGSKVVLHYARGKEAFRRRTMVGLFSDPDFEYHVAELPPGQETLEYWFEIQSGSDSLYYARLGPETEPPAAEHRFRIRPGQRVPAWTRGSVLYRLEVDRFFDAAPPADPGGSALEWSASPAANPSKGAQGYGGDLDGVALKAEFLKSLGVDAVILSDSAGPKGLADPADPASLAGLRRIAERLSAKGIKTFATFAGPSPGKAGDEYFAAIAADAAPPSGFMGFVSPFGGTDEADMRRFKEAVKSGNPEAAVLAEPGPAGSAYDSSIGDFLSDPTGFSGLASTLLTGADMRGQSLPESLADTSGFARAFMDAAATIPQQMADTAVLTLDPPGAERFISRAARLAVPGAAKKEAKAQELQAAGRERYRVALILQMTLPGSPLIQYGAEAGIAGEKGPDAYRSYPWGREDKEILALHKDLAAVRAGLPCLRAGSFALISSDPAGVLVFARWDQRQRVVVAVNAGTESQTLRIPLSQLGLGEGDRLRTALSVTAAGHAVGGPGYTVRSGIVRPVLLPLSAVILSGPASKEPTLRIDSRPRVTRTFPARGAKGLAGDTRVILQFSEPMDQASIAEAFSVEPPVEGSFSWNGSTCAFVPSEPLKPKTSYEITVDRDATTRDGGFSMAASYSLSFSTR